jgi:hypothetical protein
MVVLLALVACGKTGDPTLEPAARGDVLDIREGDFSMHLERHGNRFSWDYRTVRRDKADVERADSGTVGATAVDRFLHAVASQHTGAPFSLTPPDVAERYAQVSIRSRDPGASLIDIESASRKRWRTRERWLVGEPSPIDDAYEAMMTTIGRPPMPPTP